MSRELAYSRIVRLESRTFHANGLDHGGASPLDQPAFPADFVAHCQSWCVGEHFRMPNTEGLDWPFCSESRACPTGSTVCSWTCIPTPSACGRHARPYDGLVGRARKVAGKPVPLATRAVVKAIACEAICQTGLPLEPVVDHWLGCSSGDRLRANRPSIPAPFPQSRAPTRSSHGVIGSRSPRDPQLAEKAGRP